MLDSAALKTVRPPFVTPCFGAKLGVNYLLASLLLAE